MKKVVILFLCCLGLVGCATMSDVINPNRENLMKLSIGMTKDEVIKIMGKDTKTAYKNPAMLNILSYGMAAESQKISNPYRSEILPGKDKTLEVWYYVTDDKTGKGIITDDCLTPLVFDNGKLIGWGQGFLQDNAQKYEIRIR
ncbi:MAG: DUF3192 domain-containing protein [Candidatus Omnitrophota bacterium]